jgi:hypothetical protein
MAHDSNKKKADASPAKKFFVDMLVKDIELQDAIIDLLDNSVDGAMRLAEKMTKQGAKPYAGCAAWITLSKDRFEILDNCGGIPVELAEQYAFRMGRADSERDKDLPTVGVYGIGMKRAVFKLGRQIDIASRTSTEGFNVSISPEWLDSDDDWELPLLVDNEALDTPGTKIEVRDLRDGIPRLFADETDFVETLRTAISSYYAYIIEKGFEVYVNDKAITPLQVELLAVDDGQKSGVKPFVYETAVDGVSVELAVGLYRPLPKEEEEDEALNGRPTTERAGWTIVCNDRVVLFADKTRVTGWGEATVPQYHTQFVSIAGTVIFKSNNALKLPITTTKRGIDGNSELYLAVKDHMREGLKLFTDFTNKWKKSTKELQLLNAGKKTVRSQAASTVVPSDGWSNVTKGAGGRKFRPSLPLPKEDDPNVAIRFTRPASEVAELAEYLFDDATRSGMDVGMKCFDDALKRARK